MIHRVSASNYFSIRDEAVLDLRIPKTAPDLPRFRQSQARPDIRLPSVAVLMGPNGSGKTPQRAECVRLRRPLFPLPPPVDDERLTQFQPFRATRPSLDPTRIRIDLEADWLSPGSAAELFRKSLLSSAWRGGATKRSSRFSSVDREGLHVHLRTSAAGGGSSRAVVEDAARALGRLPRRQFADRLVLVDADRVEQDPRERQETSAVAERWRPSAPVLSAQSGGPVGPPACGARAFSRDRGARPAGTTETLARLHEVPDRRRTDPTLHVGRSEARGPA